MNETQIASLTPELAYAVTPTQFESLSAEKKRELEKLKYNAEYTQDPVAPNPSSATSLNACGKFRDGNPCY